MLHCRSGLSVAFIALAAVLMMTMGDAGSARAQVQPPTAARTPVQPDVATPAPPAALPQESNPQPVEEDPIETAPPGGMLTELLDMPRSDLPHNLSPLGMFLAADVVVKAVMLSLAFASFLTWTIWLAKTMQIAGARSRAMRGLKLIGAARTLDGAIAALDKKRGIVAAMLAAASDELRFSDAAIDHAGGAGVKERVGSTLGRIEARGGRHMAKGTGVLATIGSTAPFVGLFGTVWGIMNAFIGISESQTTNLAVVAPGIAEALLATAIGLVAAIPAVIIYNVFARSVTAYRQLLADAAAAVERLVSRDLDFRKVPAQSRAATIKLATE